MKTFHSKPGIAILLFIAIIFGGIVVAMVIDEVPFEGLITVGTILSCLFGFIILLFETTIYQITEDKKLRVRFSFLSKVDIDISKIKTVKKIRTVLAAPAPSFDRIEVTYNTYDSVVISPKNKNDFAQHLKEINPNIEIQLS